MCALQWITFSNLLLQPGREAIRGNSSMTIAPRLVHSCLGEMHTHAGVFSSVLLEKLEEGNKRIVVCEGVSLCVRERERERKSWE